MKQTTFVQPSQVLPKWIGASVANRLAKCGGQLFDSADTGRSGHAVTNLGNSGARNGCSIGQQRALLPGHSDQRCLDGFKGHGVSSPIVDMLTAKGYAGNRETTHIRVSENANIPGMQESTPSRKILAANLNRLMSKTWALNSNTKLVKRSGLGLGTMGRVRNAEAAATIDTLDRLAECFGVQPWQLLVPLDAQQPQQPQQPPQTELQLLGAQAEQQKPTQTEAPAIQPSSTAQELAVLFDLLTGRDGKIDRAEVFTAAVEAISRSVTGRHAAPTDAPQQPVQAKKQGA